MSRHSLATLPNQAGFRFIGVTHADETMECEVRVNPVGMHGVYRTSDGSPVFFQLTSWQHKTGEQP